MPNVTLSIEEKTLAAGRRYAHSHHTSLNALIRKLLRNAVVSEEKTGNWRRNFLKHADEAGGDSKGRAWSRRDLYDV